MSAVESTLRTVNGRLIGNRNFRLSLWDEDWDRRHVTLRRQLMEQEAHEIVPIVNSDGIAAVMPEIPNEDNSWEDRDSDYHRVDLTPELEEFFGAVNSGELFDDTSDDDIFSDLTIPGAVTFDSDRMSTPASEDRRWDGLQDDLDAMQDVHRNNLEEHEIHLDGISDTHRYHAARVGITVVDRFDIYGDRNPRAWWPVLECA